MAMAASRLAHGPDNAPLDWSDPEVLRAAAAKTTELINIRAMVEADVRALDASLAQMRIELSDEKERTAGMSRIVNELYTCLINREASLQVLACELGEVEDLACAEREGLKLQLTAYRLEATTAERRANEQEAIVSVLHRELQPQDEALELANNYARSSERWLCGQLEGERAKVGWERDKRASLGGEIASLEAKLSKEQDLRTATAAQLKIKQSELAMGRLNTAVAVHRSREKVAFTQAWAVWVKRSKAWALAMVRLRKVAWTLKAPAKAVAFRFWASESLDAKHAAELTHLTETVQALESTREAVSRATTRGVELQQALTSQQLACEELRVGLALQRKASIDEMDVLRACHAEELAVQKSELVAESHRQLAVMRTESAEERQALLETIQQQREAVAVAAADARAALEQARADATERSQADRRQLEEGWAATAAARRREMDAELDDLRAELGSLRTEFAASTGELEGAVRQLRREKIGLEEQLQVQRQKLVHAEEEYLERRAAYDMECERLQTGWQKALDALKIRALSMQK